MRLSRWLSTALTAFTAVAGCAAHAPSPQTRPSARAITWPATRPTTRPSDPSELALDQIKPRPLLRAAPTTRRSSPPLEALVDYAQARDAQLNRDLTRASVYLRKALDLDPDSYQLNYAMGVVIAAGSQGNQQAINYFLRAAASEPDHVEVQLALGRHYLARNDLAHAIEHLRLALQTTGYRREPEAAAKTSFFLARALQQKGYDTAAIGQYDRLFALMDRRLDPRQDPELYYLLARPESLFIQAGQLNEKHGRYARAAALYQDAIDREPSSFDYRAYMVRLYVHVGHVEEAMRLAGDLAVENHASPASIRLLKEVCEAPADDSAAPGARVPPDVALLHELQRLQQERPDDRFLAFALADQYAATGNVAEAEQLLNQAVADSHGDSIVVSRLFDFYLSRQRNLDAARVIILALAQRPDSIEELDTLWMRLQRAGTGKRVRLPDLQSVPVPATAEASRLYWVSRLAAIWNRASVERSSLEKAVQCDPPFAPAYRALTDDISARRDLTSDQRAQLVQRLVDRVNQAGRKELAAELRGRLLIREKKPDEARKLFEEAVKLGNRSPSLQYALAMSMVAGGKTAAAEQLLWQLTSDFPGFDTAYLTLFRLCMRQGGSDGVRGAQKVLNNWRATDPFNVNARLLQVQWDMSTNRLDRAESALSLLFQEEPANPDVLQAMFQFYERINRMSDLYRKLEDEQSRHPGNRAVTGALVQVYLATKRTADARRVIDELAQANANDPDQLYFVAHMYDLIDQPQLTEKILAEVLQLDPRHAPAANDLGYMWADRGVHLDRSEELIRQALQVEPDNSAYLDSLGWVLYKRSKFTQARDQLQKAVDVDDFPDPVVLDHLADTLYREGRREDARKAWQRAIDRLIELGSERDDYVKLRLELREKVQALDAGKPVKVAPTIAGPTTRP